MRKSDALGDTYLLVIAEARPTGGRTQMAATFLGTGSSSASAQRFSDSSKTRSGARRRMSTRCKGADVEMGYPPLVGAALGFATTQVPGCAANTSLVAVTGVVFGRQPQREVRVGEAQSERLELHNSCSETNRCKRLGNALAVREASPGTSTLISGEAMPAARKTTTVSPPPDRPAALRPLGRPRAAASWSGVSPVSRSCWRMPGRLFSYSVRTWVAARGTPIGS